MKNKRLTFLLAITPWVLHAQAQDDDVFARAAIINLHAAHADVTGAGDEKIITLSLPSKLATMSSRTHLPHQRAFMVFPVSELAGPWNSCNAMKAEHQWFHADGVNSVLTFDAGPSEHGHVSTAPLLTQSGVVRSTTGGAEGALYLMLTDAIYRDGRLSFKTLGEVDIGRFENVELNLECFSFSGRVGGWP